MESVNNEWYAGRIPQLQRPVLAGKIKMFFSLPQILRHLCRRILIKEALMSKMKDNLLEIAVNLVVILSVMSTVLKVSL